MTQIGDFDRWISQENFVLGWRRIKHSVRYDQKDRTSISVYSSQVVEQLDYTRHLVLSETFKPTVPPMFRFPKKDGSQRLAPFLEFDDRLVYFSIANIIAEACYEDLKLFSKRSYGHVLTPPDLRLEYMFRPAFSPHPFRLGQFEKFSRAVLSNMKQFKEEFVAPWLIRTDVASFYPTISHKTLLDYLSSQGWLRDPRIVACLELCLGTWQISEFAEGLPIGYEPSDLLANLFLTQVDDVLSQYVALRYVDDFYIFAGDLREAKSALAKLDSALHRVGLQRNAAKTELVCLNEISSAQVELRFRNDLSSFRDPKLSIRRQKELLKHLTKDAHSSSPCDCANAQRIADPATVGFVLYRLKRRNRYALSLAWCLLEHYPRYAVHAATYISSFLHEEAITKRLWAFVESDFEPSLVRFYCLQALCKVSGFDEIHDFVSSQLQSNADWQFVYNILDLIPNDNSFRLGLLRSAKNTEYTVIACKLLKRAYELCSNDRERIAIINYCFDSRKLPLQRLGIYLWRRHMRIDASSLHTARLSPEMQSRFLSPSELNLIADFRNYFRDVFGYTIPSQFPIEETFGDKKRAVQVLINAVDHFENGMNAFVLSLHELTYNMLCSLAEIQTGEHSRGIPTVKGLVKRFFLNDKIIKQRTYPLSQHYSEIEQNELVDEDLRSGLIEQTRQLYQYTLNIIYRHHFGVHMRNEVFICYAHNPDDEVLRDMVKKSLTPYVRNRITVWSDTDIPKGQDWDEKIKEALDRAKVAFLIVSMDFLHSNYINETELPAIMRAAKEDGLVIAWIAARPSAYEATEIGKLQCAHAKPEIALSERSPAERERAIVEVAKFVASCFA